MLRSEYLKEEIKHLEICLKNTKSLKSWYTYRLDCTMRELIILLTTNVDCDQG